MKDHRRKTHGAGLLAEIAAAWMLRLKGYRIIARRVKTPAGEIDIIARRGNVTAFVEVKKRRSEEDALAALRPRQMQRMAKAARIWLASHPAAMEGACRFDLVAVNDWMWPVHVANAFGEDEAAGW